MQQAYRRSFEASAVLTLVCFYILCNNKSYKEPSGFLRAEPLSSNFEDRMGIGEGNNQQRFEVKKLLSEKSVFPSLITAPIDDEAKKHNENLPGMGGVFNVVNLHVYHYAGYSQRSFELYNPIKYVDPDGRDIHILTLGGVGAKLVIGGSLNIGIAWDDNGNSALVMTGGFGVGVEAQLHTFLTPSYSVTKGKNIDDLPGIGSTRISFNASLTGTEANVGVGIGINFDMESNEISGINAGIFGGGVNFIGFARFKIIKHGEKSRSAEQLKEIIDTIKNLDSIPDDIKQEMLKTIKEMI